MLYNPKYAVNILKLINNIIYFFIADIIMTKDINQKVLLVKLDKTNKKFILKLYKNSNIIIFKT